MVIRINNDEERSSLNPSRSHFILFDFINRNPIRLMAILLRTHFLPVAVALLVLTEVSDAAFLPQHDHTRVRLDRWAPVNMAPSQVTRLSTDSSMKSYGSDENSCPSRRRVLGSLLTASSTLSFGLSVPPAVAATERVPLEDLLYRILRVREATQQETRLIKTGKFKDLQRANVKLAVKFMLDNYRLADAFIAASTYLQGGTQRRIEAGQVGQNAVQNLYTILEYFDSSDVQNIKVGSDTMTGKEVLVLKGLDAARDSIDDFLAFFPPSDVEPVKAKVREENELNVKEFDPSLGTIVNLPTP